MKQGCQNKVMAKVIFFFLTLKPFCVLPGLVAEVCEQEADNMAQDSCDSMALGEADQRKISQMLLCFLHGVQRQAAAEAVGKMAGPILERQH